MLKQHKLTIALVAVATLSGCATTEEKVTTKASVSWHTLGQQANYAGVNITKINGQPVKAERKGFGSWSHRVQLEPGTYEIEYQCKTLHELSSQVQDNPARVRALKILGNFADIDYGQGKTTLTFSKGESYFFQAKYNDLKLNEKPGVGAFTGQCDLAKVEKKNFFQTMQSNLMHIR